MNSHAVSYAWCQDHVVAFGDARHYFRTAAGTYTGFDVCPMRNAIAHHLHGFRISGAAYRLGWCRQRTRFAADTDIDGYGHVGTQVVRGLRDPKARFYVSTKDKGQVSRPIDFFATFNKMYNCVTPDDI